MRHIWQQTLPLISHNWHFYTIDHVRNFIWESDMVAEQIYTTITLDIHKIHSCKIYQSTFWFGNIIAHYMIGFCYTSAENKEEEIILSIEARRPYWDKYALRKWLIPWMYSIMYTWGTPRDILSLRKHVWHDPLRSHTLTLSAKETQNLFIYFTHRTNYIHHNKVHYHAFIYNCLTDLHSWISHISKKLFPITRRTIMSKGYIGYLRRNKLIA